MATVYRAYDRSLDIERAIKILAPHLVARSVIRERFATEARTMARLHHPNIVAVHDVGSDGDRLFIVMEYLDGGEVHGRMEKAGVYPPRLATYVIKGMLAGLQVAHDKGITHRDIKPHNVLISSDGIPKVTDFGIAQVSDTNSGLTRTGMVMGTLAYMAPEQRSGARNADNRSDIYAVAATLFNLLTNDEPFDLFSSEVREDMLLKVGEPLSTIIRKGCAYKGDQRYQTCNEMLKAIEAVEDQLPETPADHPPLAMPPSDTLDTQVPLAPSGSGISVETFDSSLAVNTDAGVDRSRSDPFGNFDPVSGQFRKSSASNMDSGATFFEIDDEDFGEEITASVPVSAFETPASKKRNTALLMALGVIVVIAGLGGMFVLGQRGASTQDSLGATVEQAVVAQLEASAAKQAAAVEESTIEVLKKAENAVKIEVDEKVAPQESVKQVEAVRKEVKTQLAQVKEVATDARAELKRVVETTPELQSKIDVKTLDNLVDLEQEGLTKLIEELPPSVKAMVQRQWEHDKRVQRLEEATSKLQEQYVRLEALANAAEEAAKRAIAARKTASVSASTPAPAAPVAVAVPAPEVPPPVSGNVPLGKVILNAKPYSKFYLDGREVKMAGRKPLDIPVGRHTLIFQDTTSPRRYEMPIVVSGSRVNRFCWHFDEERNFCQ
jgi:serine/threonine-protein kinase